MSRPKTDQSVVVQMKALYVDAGKTLKEVATEVGKSVPTVARCLKEAGVVVHPRGRRTKTVIEESISVEKNTTNETEENVEWKNFRDEFDDNEVVEDVQDNQVDTNFGPIEDIDDVDLDEFEDEEFDDYENFDEDDRPGDSSQGFSY